MNRLLLIDDIENSPNKQLHLDFNEFIEEIESKTPVKANLIVKSLGDYVEITGHVSAVVYLECDLCLNKYEYTLDFDIDELYTKDSLFQDYGNSGKEFEIKDGHFITDLNGKNEIDIYDLLYQSVILNFPNKKVCGINCIGKEYLSEQDTLDPRLEVFDNLQINPKK